MGFQEAWVSLTPVMCGNLGADRYTRDESNVCCDRPMTLGVRFELKNLSIETRLRYRLILQKREPRPEGRATQWVGDLVFCGEIGPLGSRLVGATCWVVEEGALDVGRWVCESRLTGEEADGWSQWGLQRLVSVRDSRSRLAVMDDLV